MQSFEYADLIPGQTASFEKKITKEDLEIFSILTGDKNPLHLDESYAKNTPFKERVVYGLLLTSLLSTLSGMYLPGRHSLILKIETKMRKPCFIGDKVRVEGKLLKKIDSLKMIVLQTNIKNQHEIILQEGEMHIKVLK